MTGKATLVSFFWPAYNIFKLEGEEGRKEEASIGAIATKGTKRERETLCVPVYWSSLVLSATIPSMHGSRLCHRCSSRPRPTWQQQ